MYPFRPRNDLYSILYEYYILGKISSTALFSVPASFDYDGDHVTVTLIDKLIYVFYIGLIVLSQWYQFTEFIFTSNKTNSILLDIGTCLTMTSSSILIVSTMSYNIVRRRSIWKIFQNLNAIDRTLITQFNVQIDYKLQYISYVAYGIFSHVAFFTCAGFSQIPVLYNLKPYIFRMMFVQLFSYGTIFLTYNYFITLSRFFRWRLTSVNNLVAAYFFGVHKRTRKEQICEQAMWNASCHLDEIEVVHIVSEMFSTLNETLGLIMQIYNFKLIVLCLTTYVYTLFTLFGIYRLAMSFNLEEFALTAENIIWDLAYIVLYILAIAVSSSIAHENKKTMKLIYKIINRTPNETLADQLLQFAMQLNQQALNVATNLFTLNWEFIYSNITAAAAYLILLIQFEDASTSA